MSGKVWLVGAGTGDAGLITVKGRKILKQAEVVIFDALISLEVLSLMPVGAELIDAGKRAGKHTLPQDEINRLLVSKAREGKRVVRLKGGDSFVFGRGGEELEALVDAGIDFEVVPGVTSAVVVPAYNGIPITHRDYASSFHVITGHKKKNGNLDIDFKALVRLDATLIFLMGAVSLENICQGLLDAGMAKDTPAAVLEKGTTCRQRSVYATLSTLKEKACKAFIESPVVIIIGKVCELGKQFAWYEKLPLSGKQILVTRPHQEGVEEYLTLKLQEFGAHIINMPTIETVKINSPSELEKFYSAVEKVQSDKGKKCIVFTSSNGVRYFFSLLKERKIDIRSLFVYGRLEFAVIGSGTRDELERYNIFADYMPKKYSAQSLGKMLVDKLSKDFHIYIFRAVKGSIELTNELKKAKIPYSDIAIYNTVYTRPNRITEKIAAAFDNKEIDYVTFTSASTVKGFVSIFENVNLQKVKAVCIGDKTANEALKYNMDIIVSNDATINSLVEAILKKAKG